MIANLSRRRLAAVLAVPAAAAAFGVAVQLRAPAQYRATAYTTAPALVAQPDTQPADAAVRTFTALAGSAQVVRTAARTVGAAPTQVSDADVAPVGAGPQVRVGFRADDRSRARAAAAAVASATAAQVATEQVADARQQVADAAAVAQGVDQRVAAWLARTQVSGPGTRYNQVRQQLAELRSQRALLSLEGEGAASRALVPQINALQRQAGYLVGVIHAHQALAAQREAAAAKLTAARQRLADAQRQLGSVQANAVRVSPAERVSRAPAIAGHAAAGAGGGLLVLFAAVLLPPRLRRMRSPTAGLRRRGAHRLRTSGEIRRAVRLFGRYAGGRKAFVVALLLLIAEAATAVIEPWPLSYLIDFLQGTRLPLRSVGLPGVLSSARLETVIALVIAVIVIAMINSAADSFAEIYLARGGRVLGYNLRVALYQHLKRLSVAYHDQRRSGDVLTRVTGDVTVLEEFTTDSLSNLAGGVLVLIGSLTFLLIKSWQVALIGLLIVPLLALVSTHYSKLVKSASKRQRASEGELASGAQEMLSSIRVVQTYGQSGYDTRRFGRQSMASMRAALDAAVVQAKFSWVVAVMEALTISVIVLIGLWLLDSKTITVGTLVLFILLIQNMFKPTRKIIMEWSTIGKMHASVERIGDLLDLVPEVQDAPDAVPAPRFAGHVAFDGVSFSYRLELSDAGTGQRVATVRPALRDVSLDVEPGRVLAVVGHSGAGKSTIAQLVPRLYDPDSGCLRIDGQDIRRYTLASLRSQISVVLQDAVLFSGSVADNIAYGLSEVTLDEVRLAARLANAEEFIELLPQGYETLLGERGANLSGGQRQRIAIARAFIRNPPILILDEPTTGLDVHSARLVIDALDELMRNKTTIIMSHDLGLIRRADRICVLDGGRIVAHGTHDELLHAGGLYAELYRKQFGLEQPVQLPRIVVPEARPDIDGAR